MHVQEELTDSQFFILPSEFFRHLKEELLKSTHNKELTARVMFGLGRSTAVTILNSHVTSELESESFEHVVHMHWAEVGLGMMSIWTGKDGNYIIQNKRGTEARVIGFTGEPSCHFSRGYLVGLALGRNHVEYNAVETECICQGYDHCTFVLSKA